jgi:hypothetical protein
MNKQNKTKQTKKLIICRSISDFKGLKVIVYNYSFRWVFL